ncbi:MAG: ATP-binding protein [Mollicutes bacterium]|nr:ATP-binding protein [Mollicutes bacterium]MDD7264286.1 ATP-binding protein [bacterium]MDY4979316.1 ATP-binding protein [Candidatus Onthovivens sp.]
MLIKRNKYLNEIRKYYDSNLIKVITGIRRSGKSILLEQIQEEIKNNNSIDNEHIIVINFEDLKYSKLNNSEKLNEYIINKILDDNKYYVFLDEIQHVHDFEKVLASLKATQNISLFVTGSNSKLLSGKLATLLVGRCKEFKVMPFSFQETIDFYKENNLPLPAKPFNDYLRYGGMPQRFDYNNEEDIKSYLKEIFYGIIDKDICNSKSKINKDTFISIAKYIIANSSKEFSAEKISEYFNRYNKENISPKHIYRYLEKLEQACLINRVHRYDVASKRNLKNIEKQFVVDNGFLLIANESNFISPSHALENLVYNELIYRGYDVKIGKTYKGEIDFVVLKDNKKCFIQVAYMLINDDVIDREFNAFKSVRDASPKYVLSLDDIDMSKDGITHLNIEDWLLHKKDLFLS